VGKPLRVPANCHFKDTGTRTKRNRLTGGGGENPAFRKVLGDRGPMGGAKNSCVGTECVVADELDDLAIPGSMIVEEAKKKVEVKRVIGDLACQAKGKRQKTN